MFVTFEGLEGCGKTTQIGRLANYLQSAGYPVLVTREPGGTRIGEEVRATLHDLAHGNMAAQAEVLLYSAARAQLVAEVIRPALDGGAIVLSDRYADSTLAYQGAGRRLDLDALDQITAFATGGLKPDLTFFLDVGIAEGLARREGAGLEINRMDRQTLAFYERVREGYCRLIGREPARWVVLDGGRPADDLELAIRECVLGRLPGPEGS
jgi:dTMP kinase